LRIFDFSMAGGVGQGLSNGKKILTARKPAQEIENQLLNNELTRIDMN